MHVEAVEDYHSGASSATSASALHLKDSILENAEQYLVLAAEFTHAPSVT